MGERRVEWNAQDTGSYQEGKNLCPRLGAVVPNQLIGKNTGEYERRHLTRGAPGHVVWSVGGWHDKHLQCPAWSPWMDRRKAARGKLSAEDSGSSD
jgi:hypothetical protein